MATTPRPKTTYHRYTTYLLRLWQDRPGSPLRASLQRARGDERYIFATLDKLLSFLQAQGETETEEQ